MLRKKVPQFKVKWLTPRQALLENWHSRLLDDNFAKQIDRFRQL